jgi:hypothetical protein
MSPPAFQLPGSAFMLVAMWSSVELLVCIAELDPYVEARVDGAAESVVLPFCIAGLISGWLFVLTWLLLGARPKANLIIPVIDTIEFNVIMNRDRLFRVAILVVIVAEMTLLSFSTIHGQWLLGIFVAFAIPCLAWPTIYRQITGRRIARYEQQVGASLDIRGIILVTVLIATATSLCRDSESLEPETLMLAIALGTSIGMVWLSVALWMLNRRRRWFLLSVLSSWLPVAVMAIFSLSQRILGPDLVGEAVVATLAICIHAAVYFGTLRASDYRLGLDTSSPNLR